MKLAYLFKAAAALTVATGLAGCLDMDMQVEVTGTDHAIATITTSISKEMVNLADIEAGKSDFCNEGGTAVETETGVTCTETHEGTFAEVFPASADGQPQPTITMVGDSQARIVFPTGSLAKELSGSSGADDEEAKKMMRDMFEGHALTIRVVADVIVDTNMTLSADKTSAELVLPFTDIIEGKLVVPDEAYAVVQLP